MFRGRERLFHGERVRELSVFSLEKETTEGGEGGIINFFKYLKWAVLREWSQALLGGAKQQDKREEISCTENSP